MTTLVADVGGTNTRVAVFADGEMTARHVERFRNENFSSLEDVLGRYLDRLDGTQCSAACVAVAGPVRAGTGRLTNLDWTIDAPKLCRATGAKDAFVINDLEAQGHALDDVETRRVLGPDTSQDTSAPRLVVGVGTGFNAAPVHPVEGGAEFHVVPSECGHISLPVWDDTSFALATSLATDHDFASVEEALSGRGLLALNRFAAKACGVAPHASTTEIIEALDTVPKPSDRMTASLMCQVLGRVLGDLALIHLPWGGIYLIGGLARAMSPFFDTYGLTEGFHDKGRFSGFMDDFGIFIVEDDYAALRGCARYVRRHI